MSQHHHHIHKPSDTKNLKTAFFLNLAFTILEFVGGVFTNSIAIVSDAIHDLGDSLALGTAWFLQSKSDKQADERFSFGYKRLSLLGALINSIILLVGGVYIIYSAINRILHPEPSDAEGMLLFAFIGIAVNGYAAWKMSSGKTLNERVVAWHLIEDVLGWVAILIVSIIMQFTDNQYLDPALSLLITAYILFNVVKRLKETLFIFLQGQPDNLNRVELEKRITNLKGVKSIHHFHIWSLDGENHVLSLHVVLQHGVSIKEAVQLKKEIKDIITEFPFDHYTIELEFEGEYCELAN